MIKLSDLLRILGYTTRNITIYTGHIILIVQ